VVTLGHSGVSELRGGGVLRGGIDILNLGLAENTTAPRISNPIFLQYRNTLFWPSYM